MTLFVIVNFANETTVVVPVAQMEEVVLIVGSFHSVCLPDSGDLDICVLTTMCVGYSNKTIFGKGFIYFPMCMACIYA